MSADSGFDDENDSTPEEAAKIMSIMDIVIEGEVLTDGFVYASPEEEAQMREIVSVWKKIRWYREYTGYLGAVEEAVADSLQELLMQWRASGGLARQMVAFAESLSPKVLQRAFEYYNIDFASMESYIRRITILQYDGLLHTLRSVESGEIPECYREGLANHVDKFRRPEVHTLEAIQADSGALGDRYVPRNARSTDILGLGFGYHKYLSLKNDMQESPSTIEQARNLLSLDHQVSVNRLYGIYAFLYAMLPIPRRGEVGSWFCPGFHVTLWGWLAILVGSPIALAFGVPAWEHSPLYVSIPLLIAGAWLPLALYYALMWYIFARLIKKEKRDAWGKNIRDYCALNMEEDYWAHIAISLLATLGVVAALGVAAAAGYGVYLWFWESVPYAIVYGLFTFLWMMHLGKEKELCLPWKMDGLRILGTALCTFLVLRLGYDLVMLSLPFLREAASAVVLAMVFVACAFIGGFSAFGAFSDADDFRKQAFWGNDDINVARQRELRRQSLYWLLPVALLFAVGYAYLASSDSKLELGWERAMYYGLSLFGLLCIVIFVQLSGRLRIDVEHAKRFRAYKSYVWDDPSSYSRGAHEVALKMLEKSEWFSNLPLEGQRDTAQRLKIIADYIFHNKNIPPAFWSMRGDAFDDLWKIYHWDFPLPSEVTWSRENRHRLAVLVLEGVSIEEGAAILKKRTASVERFFAVVSAPFKPVGQLLRGIRTAGAFVKDIASRCPRVSESARAQ